jgi:hypothetical protein
LVVDVTVLATDITTALKTVAGISAFDGYVPAKVPEAGGFILPYVVLWLGVGENPNEPTSDGIHSTDTLILDFQVTVVASNPAACRAVAQAVKQALTNLQTGTGRIKPNPDSFDQPKPILDTTITPARFMLPIQWRLITN